MIEGGLGKIENWTVKEFFSDLRIVGRSHVLS